MARQNIEIGALANDGTGDFLRVGGSKINDNFIELYGMFDAWPGDFAYWPLGGAADLTAHTTVDGNSFDLSFGNPNPLNSFDVSVIENFHFHSDDGTYHGHVEIVNEAINHYLQLLFTDGTDVTSLTLQDNLLTLIADDGVDNSSITFSPLNAIFNLADAGQFAIRDEAAADILVVTEDLTTVVATDGVDSSSLSLTPTGLDFQLASSVLTIEDNAGAVNALFLLYGSDSFYSMGSDDFVSADTAYLSLSNSSVPNNTSSIGFQKTTLEYFDLSFGLNGDTGLEQALFRDTRTIKRGIEYADSWDSDDWTEETLTTKGYVDSLFSTGSGGPIALTSYTVAGVPSASPAGRLIYVSNESGGPQPAFSDGTDWRRITDGNIVS